MRNLYFGAACACMFATSAWAQDISFDRPYWLDRSVIESIGRSQIETPADTVSFEVTFREVDDNARDATFAASDRARLAAEAIRSRGGDAVRITSDAAVEAIHQQYRNREGERISNERADQIDNYAVSVTLSVRLSDVARAVNVRAAAMAVGPETVSDLVYSLEEDSPSRLRAYRAAVQDAAARARIAAEGSGAALGRLLVLQEGQGPCLGRWESGAARLRGIAPSGASVVGLDDDREVVVTGTLVRELRLTAADIARMQLPEDAPPVQVSARVCAVYAVGP